MKVTIEFDDEDGRYEAIDALRVHEYKVALEGILNEIRRLWKYEGLGEEASEVIERLRSFAFEEVGCLLDD